MMCTFSIRRTALIWNSRAIAVFPGGLGTINELFEAWCAAHDHKVTCPIVVVPNDFYKPLLDGIEKAAVYNDRATIAESDFNMLQRAKEDAEETVELLTQPIQSKDSGAQFTLREKLIYLRHEFGKGISAVSNLNPALIVMGSKFSLKESDSEVQFLSLVTEAILARTSFDIRVGVDGLLSDTVNKISKEHANRVQRVLMTDAMGFMDANAYFESRSAHCETLLCNAVGAIFLPSDIPSLNVLFALVCEIQTRRRANMPVFLVGREFWKPILDVSASKEVCICKCFDFRLF